MKVFKAWFTLQFLYFCFINNISQSEARIPLQSKLSELQSEDVRAEVKYNSTFRLSPALVATDYSIELRPILEQVEGSNDVLFTAPGKVTISLFCANQTNTIVVHSRRLIIYPDTVNVSSPTDASLPIANQEYKVEDDTYVITMVNNLTTNTNYSLTISYLANMDGKDGLNGLYRAYYVDEEGKTHNLAATHMEPTRARKAFPCFDEPGLKARFDMRLGRLTNYHTLSNTVIVKTEDIPGLTGWVWDIYEVTVPMPTYLVAAVVSDLVATEPEDPVFDKPVRIWSTKKLIEDGAGDYAAEVADRTLKFFELNFDVLYALSKMDSAAIPQFSPGAMENYGLNLYRENLLLIFPGITSEAEREGVANVIGHELAHQWFGNYVTCKWWSDIWLNEGFATYMSYEGEEQTAPEFEPSKRFFTDVFQVALKSDVLATTHPVHNPSLETVNVSPLFFDRIAYEKAGSVIRMYERVFGKGRFFALLTLYLRGKKFDAAEQDDLFSYLDQATSPNFPPNMTAKIFFDSWTLKSGYPLVRVSKITNTTGFISQEKFSLNQLQSSNWEAAGPFWHIPLSVVEAKNPSVSNYIWLQDDELSKTVTELDLADWITINPDATGFYRVLYDQALISLLEQQLNKDASVFEPVTRAEFIDDYMTFASAGYSDHETALRLTKHLGTELDLVVWQTALDHFRPIYDKFSDNVDDVTALKNYILPRINSALELIKFDHPAGEMGSNVTLRALLLNWACLFEDTRCVEFAQSKFQEWVDQNGFLPPTTQGDYQELVYCTSVAQLKADTTPFEFVSGKYKAETNSVHKTRLLNALSCLKENDKLQALLVEVTNPASDFLEADRTALLQKVAGNVNGRRLVLDFLMANFGNAVVTPQVLSAVLTTLGSYVLGSAAVAEIEQFIGKNAGALAPVSATLETALLQMRLSNDWYSTGGTRILQWLKTN